MSQTGTTPSENPQLSVSSSVSKSETLPSRKSKKPVKAVADSNDLRLSPPTKTKEPEDNGIRIARWGGRSYVAPPYNREEYGRCVICKDWLYDTRGGTGTVPFGWKLPEGELHYARGVTTTTVDGRMADVHCSCVFFKAKGGNASAEWKGRWSEMLVTEKLRSLHYSTFTSTDSESHVDILAYKDRALVPIQVRSASFQDNRYYCSLRIGIDSRKWTTMENDVDFVVVVGFRKLTTGPDIYVIPSSVIAGKQNLRFTINGFYGKYLDSWNLIRDAMRDKTKKSITVIASHLDSKIGCPSWKAGWKVGREGEVNIRPILEVTRYLFEDTDPKNPSVHFFWFLVQEIVRVTAHELSHIFHDEIRGSLVDDEADTDRLTKTMVYGVENDQGSTIIV